MSKLINVSDKTYENLMKKKVKSNKMEILKFAGKGGIDEKATANLKKGWKGWTEKYA